MKEKNRKAGKLSVIVPAYCKASTIKKDLENIDSVLSEGLKDIDYEIICVVDGLIDATLEEAQKVKSNLEEAQKVKSNRVKVFGYQQNRGKGYAVRYGFARASGNLISFLDAGMEISPASVMMLMAHLRWYNADIIVGSKRHPASRVNYPLLRHILSVGYHTFIKMFFGLPLTDTQSGIKVFRREVIEKVMPRLLVKRYAMDVEMLAVAKYLGFDRIYEAPIEVTFDKNTSSVSWKVVIRMYWDTLATFYRLRILHYYDDKNSSNWIVDPELVITAKAGLVPQRV